MRLRLGANSSHPIIIQGGMGAGVSNWRLARAVSRLGQLGVVSGTALDQIFVRRLQDGDPGGHMRRGLDHFPIPDMAKRIWKAYFVPGLLHLEGATKHIELTERWLRGQIDIPEIRDKWAEGPVVKLRLETPRTATPAQRVPVRVVLISNKVGHDYPTGPLDMIQSWVELRVADEHGRVVYASGERNERNFLEPGTFLFKAEPVDQYGNLIYRHNLWEMVGVRYRRSLFPGYSDTVEYNILCPLGGSRVPTRTNGDVREFSIPALKPGRLRIVATLNYRKIDQFLLNYGMGEYAHLASPS